MRFFRIKILISLDQPLKDRIYVDHLILGEISGLLVYERIGCVCLFCGELGHDIALCFQRARLAKLRNMMVGQNRPEMVGILKPTKGAWVTDQNKIPINSEMGPKEQQSPITPKGPVSVAGIKRAIGGSL